MIDGVNGFLFGTSPVRGEVVQANLAGGLYLAVASWSRRVLLGLLVRRYQRIEA